MFPSPEIILFKKDQILERVEKIAASITRWIENNPPRSLVLVSVLDGAKPFVRDLLKALGKNPQEMTIEVCEVRVKGTDGTGLLKNREWQGSFLAADQVKDKVVLIVDDLVDSGKTLEIIKERLLFLGAKEVKTSVLLRKFGAESGPVDFCGFDLHLDRGAMAQKGLKDYWLFGYGMDLDGQCRELDHVGWVEIKS